MSAKTKITVAKGDGIGPEIMDATLRILEAAKAPLEYDHISIGKECYEAGHSSGIPPEAWDSIRSNPAFLKAPITTPLGGGYKSLNVTIRKSLNLFANVRPTIAYTPYVHSLHPKMDLVIVRENEEDLYAGIEHQQTTEVAQVLKLITRPGSERICRYAFEYARTYGRKKVTCMTKDNIMKHTDGLFHKVFEEVRADYPDIEADHQIIDIGTARLAHQPESFDVIVTLNLYGDILSDIAALISGSVGLAGSANIGSKTSMFEAVHGSAPDIAGQGIANPSGLLLGAVQMLVHLGYSDEATNVKNAWLKTLEDGVHPGDIYREGHSTKRVKTQEFADAVIERLGETPSTLRSVKYSGKPIRVETKPVTPQKKSLKGIDVFIDWTADERDPNAIGKGLESAAPEAWKLKMITNRGVKVYPGGIPETYCTDHWRCRFIPSQGDSTSFEQVLSLLEAVSKASFEVIKTEHLYEIGGERAYSLGQGE